MTWSRRCVWTGGWTVPVLGLLISWAPLAASAEYRIAFGSFGPLNTDIYIADSDGSEAELLVAHPSLDMNATFMPDGHTIVFTSYRDGSANLYRIDVDGTGLERLTEHESYDDQAAASPDGRWLAFVSNRTGHADIWILDLESGATRNVTSHPSGDFRPAWSPDGQWIAFSSDRESTRPRATFNSLHSTEVFVVRADGSDLRRVSDSGYIAGSPAWSPDGQRIVFYEIRLSPSERPTIATQFSAPSRIVSVSVLSQERQVVAESEQAVRSPQWLRAGDFAYVQWGAAPGLVFTQAGEGAQGVFGSPRWSPDRTRVVFHRDRGGDFPPIQPWPSLDPDFDLVRTGIFPSFSPSGDRLVVSSGNAAASEAAGSHPSVPPDDLLLMNADGSGRRVLFRDPERLILGGVWSPTSEDIAFAVGDFFRGDGLRVKIGVLHADGSGLRYLADESGSVALPSWSPDGSRLVYRRANASANGLAIVNVATGAVSTLTEDFDNFPSWCAAGDTIIFTRRVEDDYELFSIRSDGSKLTRLTVTPGNDAHAACSPDGRWIAFSGSEGGFKDEAALHPPNIQPYGDIYVMRADGTDRRRLTDNPFENATTAWVPLVEPERD